MTGIETDLSVWENEGGALESDRASNRVRPIEPAPKEQQILRLLGSGVVAEWKSLPTEIQRRLFNRATSAVASCDWTGDKEQIARFLHSIINERSDAAQSKQA